MPVFVQEWDLARIKPDHVPIRLILGFYDMQLGDSARHYLLVIGAIGIGFRVGPGEVIIRFADDVGRGGQAGAGGKSLVTSQIDRILIFPEHHAGEVSQHVLQHLLRGAFCLFHLLTLGNVCDETGQEKQAAIPGIHAAALLIDPFHRAIGSVNPIGKPVGLVKRDCGLNTLPDILAVIRMDQLVIGMFTANC